MIKHSLILTSIFLSFLLLFSSPTHVLAECFASLENSCVGGPQETNCGQRQDGYYICCQQGTSCPADTPKGTFTGTCSTNGSTGIDTAIGCIAIGGINESVGSLLGWSTGIVGGIAFLLIIISGFMIITSRGNPERLQAGRELLNAAIAGVILVVFSVFILRTAGVVLGLPIGK